MPAMGTEVTALVALFVVIRSLASFTEQAAKLQFQWFWTMEYKRSIFSKFAEFCGWTTACSSQFDNVLGFSC